MQQIGACSVCPVDLTDSDVDWFEDLTGPECSGTEGAGAICWYLERRWLIDVMFQLCFSKRAHIWRSFRLFGERCIHVCGVA